jgi:RNA-directed DNA polymerase
MRFREVLIEFGRFAAANRKRRGLGEPETFNFLGFVSSKSRRGHFLIKRKTRRDRMQAKLQEVKKELRERMHQPIPKQGQWLKQIVTGYFRYHAVPTNSRALARFRHHIAHLWLRVLRRRSQRDGFTWERIEKLVDEWLPKNAYPPSLGQRAVRRQSPKVAAVCPNRARTDLCGGCSAMGGSTAIN